MGNTEPFDLVLSAAQADAPWAYERLYRSLSPSIRGYLRIQGTADPEDLTSEVFLGATALPTTGLPDTGSLPGVGSLPGLSGGGLPGLSGALPFLGR